MRGIGRVLGLALSWALVYAVPAIVIEGLSNAGIDFPFTRAVDLWPAELGLPGFLSGLVFAGLLVLTRRLPSFETMPRRRLVVPGALAGALIGCVYLAQMWPEPIAIIALVLAIATSLGALAGPGSAHVFRFVARQRGAARAGASA